MLPAILLPGIVTAAGLAFAELRPHLAGRDVIAKDLALYGPGPLPAPYSFDFEVADLMSAADAAGAERFHLVGFSAGASIAAFAATQVPDRIATLTLIEPPWLGTAEAGPRERTAMAEIGAALSGPPAQAMAGFNRLMLRPGIELSPPPPGPAPDWMASRPDGIRRLGEAFATGDIASAALAALAMPVLYVVCGDSNPDLFAAMADRAVASNPSIRRVDYPGLSHHNPPQKADPAGFAALLEDHWAEA
ncbi:alpha/beta fold hydrolase [Rhodobacterales bacterium HKCCE2091]|nr:alpha/beta fold hydrolase [Rhodobacterales bacterium HKCCE2091]